MRRSHFTFGQGLSEEGVINLTPLIDVVFVVLILFILIAPLLELDRISLASANVKREKQVITQDNQLIQIHVFSDNTIWINHTPVSKENLVSLMGELRKKHLGAIPQIYQDKKAFFGTYQVIKNALEAAGFEEMDVILTAGS